MFAELDPSLITTSTLGRTLQHMHHPSWEGQPTLCQDP